MSGPTNKVRLELRLYSGETHNYQDLANQQHMSSLEILLTKFMDHCEDFIKVQEKNREEEAV